MDKVLYDALSVGLVLAACFLPLFLTNAYYCSINSHGFHLYIGFIYIGYIYGYIWLYILAIYTVSPIYISPITGATKYNIYNYMDCTIITDFLSLFPTLFLLQLFLNN